ncbi:MAG TPA: hypothetical protein VHU40_04105 [Polyangia bacterium]|jgi:hypothetical protein|nr:hypothetical protein [Polyangia bacterium]
MMKALKVGLSVGIVSLAAVGCGGGSSNSGPPAKKGTVNPTTAMSVVMQTVSMKTALAAMDGATLSGNVEVVGLTGAQSLVQPSVAAQTEAPPIPFQPAAAAIAGPNGGTVDCTAAGCVYNKYTSGTGTAVVVFDGSILATGTADKTVVTSDLTITENLSGMGNVDFDITGSLTFTPTTIDGDLKSVGHYALAMAGANLTYDYFNEIKYTALIVPAGATTPTGGSIYAKWGITVAGLPQASQAYEGTLKY